MRGGSTCVCLLAMMLALAHGRVVNLNDDTARLNVTSTGIFCKDDQNNPLRFYKLGTPFADQCVDGLNLQAMFRLEPAAVGGFRDVKLAVQAFPGKCPKMAAWANIAESDKVADLQVDMDFQKFTFEMDRKQALQTAAEFFDTCEDQIVCLGMYAMKEGLDAAAEVQAVQVASQDFIKQFCFDQDQEAKVFVDIDLVDVTPDDEDAIPVYVQDTGNFIGFKLNDIINEVKVSVKDADLRAADPALPTVEWPQGVAIYVARRHYENCEDSASMRIQDDFLDFLPVPEMAQDDGMNVFDSSMGDKWIEFGEEGGQSCPLCGPRWLVFQFDFLGKRDFHCGMRKAVYVNFNCGEKVDYEKVQKIRRYDVIPSFEDQGTSAWMRICHGQDGSKTFKLQPDGWRYVDVEDYKNDVEVKGVARLLATSRILEKKGEDMCTPVLAEDDEYREVDDLAKGVVAECKEVSDQMMKGEIEADAALVKEKCGDHPYMMRAFLPGLKQRLMQNAIEAGSCPEGGFDPEEFLHQWNSYDHLIHEWNMDAWMGMPENEPQYCEVEFPPVNCAYRAINILMEGPKRHLANRDLYAQEVQKMELDPERPKFDDLKDELAKFVKPGVDVEFLRNCPKKGIFKPSKGPVAMWKVTDEGYFRGYKNLMADKWCWRKMAIKHCEYCEDKGYEKDESGFEPPSGMPPNGPDGSGLSDGIMP